MLHFATKQLTHNWALKRPVSITLSQKGLPKSIMLAQMTYSSISTIVLEGEYHLNESLVWFGHEAKLNKWYGEKIGKYAGRPSVASLFLYIHICKEQNLPYSPNSPSIYLPKFPQQILPHTLYFKGDNFIPQALEDSL